jgi:uncharacterized membrane protein
MNQPEINDAEWENLDNWNGWFWDIYFSKRDSRWWVRRRKPWMGWTVNLAHAKGALYLYAVCLFLLSLGLGLGLLTVWLSRR